MRLPILLVDAFANGPFTGNPASVVIYEGPLDERTMGRIAMEMNQAETAFARRLSHNEYELRWFTPTVEVDLCGHATLATAHALYESGTEGTLRFETRSGLLLAVRSEGGEIKLDFPAEPPVACPMKLFPAAVWTGRNRMDWFVVLEDESEVRGYSPDFRAISDLGMRGLILTACGRNTDFVSRCFFPQTGVDEDPVTGSAHCALAPYWAERLGRTEMVGEQASRRGGVVRTRVVGERVTLEGRAVTTLQGELTF